MFLDELRNFYITSESDSLVNASEFLYIEHSALSKHISRIEKALNVRLFHRKPKGLTLTSSGKQFQLLCRAFLDGCAALPIDNPSDMIGGRNLTIGVAATRNSAQILTHINTYMKENRDARIMIKQMHEPDLLQSLSDGRINFGIISSADVRETHLKSCESVILSRCEIKVHISAAHPLAEKDSVDFSELKNENFIVPDSYRSGNGKAKRLSRLCSQYGIDIKSDLRYSVSDASFITALVKAGIGVTLTAVEEDEVPVEGTRFLSIKHPMNRNQLIEDMLMLWNREAYRNVPLVKHFADYVMQQLENK